MTSQSIDMENEELIDSLNNDMDYLKEILISKIFEEEHLINYTCREIETDYALKFGVYKYKIKDYKLKIKKTKRTIELIKKMLNKQQVNSFNKTLEDLEPNQAKIERTKINKPKIDMKEIENHIANEFSEEELEVETETAKTNILIEEHKNNLDKKIPVRELDITFKECIRRIHPDLLFKPTEFEENLFFNAKEAYEDRDLKELKSVYNLVLSHKIEETPQTIDELEKFIKHLEIHIELEDMEISKITNSKPYTQQKFLLDQKKVNNYREGLVKSLLEVEKEYIKYKRELNDLKQENNLSYKLDLSKKN
ncbi:MAG: hypothetical protein IKV87_05950 [Methanobrevibacter sp.]|nr:hypothetical protein [Methanobrevibacter sp.]